MNFLRSKWNSTIRVRLTVLYAAAFFLAGLVFIALMYLQLNQVIGQQLIFRSVVVGERPDGGDMGPPVTYRIERSADRDDAPSVEESAVSDPANVTGELPNFPGLTEVEERFRATREEALQRIVLVSVISLVAVSAVATLLGWLLAGQALHPLRQITATAQGIANRNLHQRIALQGPDDEIKDLADTLDDMLERLDRAFDSQQRFIANASHELRTPLAINRTLIEVAMMKEGRPDAPLLQLGTTLLAVNQRHESLIDGLLMLASSEQEIANPQEVDLAEIAQYVLTESASLAQAQGVVISSQLNTAPCRGDSILLERMIQNLVDNAIRYNLPDSGQLQVSTGTDSAGRAVVIVENPGPVIPAYEVPRLFEPFRRLASTERIADSPGGSARRGAGLGLSIVRSIVTSHNGELKAAPREHGGLTISINFPAT